MLRFQGGERLLVGAGLAGVLAACGAGADAAPAPKATALTCDDSVKTSFKPDANTTVLLVKAFKTGDPLILSGSAAPDTLVASKDVCVVKLNVGPGNPGPA